MKKRHTIYFTDEEWEALRKLSYEQKKTRSALIREALKKVYRV